MAWIDSHFLKIKYLANFVAFISKYLWSKSKYDGTISHLIKVGGGEVLPTPQKLCKDGR